MAVSATPPVISSTSNPGSAGLFRSDSLYKSPADSPRLTTSINTFISCNSSSTSGNNDCKLVEVHGVKIASFTVDGQELICLPQVFDLFLKHLVGGLHTVYTKLKRLDIAPVVCTVEQVRILRGLGAIQPGVNRCKLITRKDFEALYGDCTNASSRPGRPPKRSLGVQIQENSRLLPHGVMGLLSPGLISPSGLTAAAVAEAMKLQKMKLMAMNSLHGIGNQNGTESENDELSSSAGLDLPFMMMPHPLLPVSLPPASVAMAMNQMNHLNTIANMAAAVQIHSPLSRAGASVIKERVQDSPSPAPSLEDNQRPASQASSHQSSSVSSSPSPHDSTSEHFDDTQLALPVIKQSFDKLPLSGQALPPGFPAPFLFADGLSSVETLLTNIQGLLKVAVDNARVQEKQVQQEKKELKMELFREREIRENLERQLTSELQSRATIQKRLKKEKKAKRKLQEALEFESKRREQVEQAIKQATSPESLRMLNETCISEVEAEHNGNQQENEAVQENRSYMKPSILY
ncbi:LOW QUALITY PROTEIN: dachshund homolog 2-like [Erpetoichthys calabaricus]|uniref:LOW QUALITY PROTEIN: dachshund homolog 2-like n=1 Tax=Erpetoichthys calabaricus TaxID=27687 RepID=UPI0022342B2F|nr:LOW QUALITY PROTEIN: dachshund homolog 2-like [Erpetoichthys calabaricus]